MDKSDKKISGVKVLIFDLDGTLIDSSRDLSGAVNSMRARLGLAAHDLPRVMSYIGHGARELVRQSLLDAFPNASDADVERALGYFREHYAAHLLDETRPYRGVREVLDHFSLPDARGGARTLAVLSNKPLRFARPVLEGLDLARYFRFIYGEESFPAKKPDPIGVQAILRDTGASPREAVLIGDSDIDIQTARNAGVWVAGVTYGLGNAHFDVAPPDLILDSLAELPAHLD